MILLKSTTTDDFAVAQRKPESGLKKMNMKKIKVMFNNYLLDHEDKIDEVIECVQDYIYKTENWRMSRS